MNSVFLLGAAGLALAAVLALAGCRHKPTPAENIESQNMRSCGPASCCGSPAALTKEHGEMESTSSLS